LAGVGFLAHGYLVLEDPIVLQAQGCREVERERCGSNRPTARMLTSGYGAATTMRRVRSVGACVSVRRCFPKPRLLHFSELVCVPPTWLPPMPSTRLFGQTQSIFI